MNGVLLKKMKEAVFSVLPVTVIILLVNLYVPFSTYNLISFLIGVVFLIVGIALYSLGCNTSIEDVGSLIASNTVKTKKIWLIVLVGFLVGLAVTIAEPDLSVLAGQVPSINKWLLICTIAFGVGFFVVVAILRIFFKINLKYVLLGFYALVFVLAVLAEIFVSSGFVPLSFDSGGVTTGPITVPFLMAFCIGISAVLDSKNNVGNDFGMVGICSIGPILSVLILGLITNASGTYEPTVITEFTSVGDIFMAYLNAIPKYLMEVGIALAPILAIFLIFQFASLKLPKRKFKKMLVGMVYTYIGLTLFLTGANMGFMPAGITIGKAVAENQKYLLVLIAALIGGCIVCAEPAVRELVQQIEETTLGMVKKSTMFTILIISMAIAVGLAVLRVVCEISIWYILAPMYAISIVLMFFVDDMFTAIAFDSGGVASGPLTVAFLLPLVTGAAEFLDVSVMEYAFGIVAFVAMTPLCTIQVLGFIVKLKRTKIEKEYLAKFEVLLQTEGDIIDFEECDLVERKTKKSTRTILKKLKGVKK